MSEMTPEQMREQQIANCPFCRIIKGEIPSKKVYEDDVILAVLDINPAAKGHVIVVPKEHIPLLPVMPPEIFKHLFRKSQEIIAAIHKALIVPRASQFIATGAAAGQVSPHFMLHLIPREPGDKLDLLDIESLTVDQSSGAEALANNLQIAMRNHLTREMQAGSAVAKKALGQLPNTKKQTVQSSPSLPGASAVPSPTPSPPSSLSEQSVSSTQIADTSETPQERLVLIQKVLQQYPDLARLIIDDPNQVQEFVAKNPGLGSVFEGVDIHKLSHLLQSRITAAGAAAHEGPDSPAEVAALTGLRKDGLANQPVAPDHEPEMTTLEKQGARVVTPSPNAFPNDVSIVSRDGSPATPSISDSPPESSSAASTQDVSDIPDAAVLNDTELIAYLDRKPRLKELLLHDVQQLERMRASNPRVQHFFKTVSPQQLSERVKKLVATQQGAVASAGVNLSDADMGNVSVPPTASEFEVDSEGETDDSENSGVDFTALAKYLEGSK